MNLQISGNPRLDEGSSQLYIYDTARFRDVEEVAHTWGSRIMVYPWDGAFFELSIKLFKIRSAPVPVESIHDLNSPFLKIREGVVLIAPILIAYEESRYISVKCDTVRKTEDDAKAYLVERELLK